MTVRQFVCVGWSRKKEARKKRGKYVINTDIRETYKITNGRQGVGQRSNAKGGEETSPSINAFYSFTVPSAIGPKGGERKGTIPWITCYNNWDNALLQTHRPINRKRREKRRQRNSAQEYASVLGK